MAEAFVWFQHSSTKPNESKSFYETLLGWAASDGPGGMTLFVGEKGPFAGLGAEGGDAPGWLPYVAVGDVDEATKTAVALGATLVKARTRGPAGDFSVVRDPGGAQIALWQRA